ncbi:hypothetical protein GCM10011352_28050 [Marinobacterium zhoushanense]|uniref:GGDEF domain-containing protein n=1 Tax=Marinobacterium zhoushanense TaxID=1679163 RepID=A0ABQ1KLF3_9GAMM|nr:hypothetical protein [Marinobacterium zhoushanense]GGC00268.1 hypothetical protein GCM10011352_28050 [Marinobacterium zhoushanense]
MVAPLTIAADLALLLSSGASAFWAWRQRQACTDERALLSAWALSALFILVAIPAQYLPADAGSDLGVLRRMALNLAVYISLPLMATAVYALGRRWFWAGAGWGRWLLALFAAFELSRQLGYGEEYLQALGAAMVAACAVGSVLLKQPLAVAATALLALTLTITSPVAPNWGIAWQEPALFRVLSALSLATFTAALHRSLIPARPAAQ